MYLQRGGRPSLVIGWRVMKGPLLIKALPDEKKKHIYALA
jgi:hypothetical protein